MPEPIPLAEDQTIK